MCGRYTLHFSKEKLRGALGLSLPDGYEPDYNISPGREVLAMANDAEGLLQTGMMHWGLKTPQNFHINARLESADTSPRFRESWEGHRCLLPANGFYEWYQDGIKKQPYYLFPPAHDLIYFAALWFPAVFDGALASCVVLTTQAGEHVRQIHDRSPVILPEAQKGRWLSGAIQRQELLELSAQPDLTSHTVSQRVNSIQNKDSGLILATAPQNDEQMQLF